MAITPGRFSTAPQRQWPYRPRLLVTYGVAHQGIRAPSAVRVRRSGWPWLRVYKARVTCTQMTQSAKLRRQPRPAPRHTQHGHCFRSAPPRRRSRQQFVAQAALLVVNVVAVDGGCEFAVVLELLQRRIHEEERVRSVASARLEHPQSEDRGWRLSEHAQGMSSPSKLFFLPATFTSKPRRVILRRRPCPSSARHSSATCTSPAASMASRAGSVLFKRQKVITDRTDYSKQK